MRDLYQILRGGYCTRWHANPDLAHIRETLAEHHGLVVQILLALHPAPSVALLDAAAHHDAGEPGVGDLPRDFKVRHPEVAVGHAVAEQAALERLGLRIEVSAAEARWLKFADMLAAFAHVSQVRPGLLIGDGWPEMALALAAESRALGCGPEVLALLRAWGAWV